MYAVQVEEYIYTYVSEYVMGGRSPIFNRTEGVVTECVTCIYSAKISVCAI